MCVLVMSLRFICADWNRWRIGPMTAMSMFQMEVEPLSFSILGWVEVDLLYQPNDGHDNKHEVALVMGSVSVWWTH